MNRILDVYLHNNLAGTLVQDRAGDLKFTYDGDYRESAMRGISLSLSLDTESSSDVYRGEKVKAFFSGLLPDESVRERLAAYLGVSRQNSFSLLEIVGGDCAGALALYPQDQKPSEAVGETEELDDKRLKEILDIIRRRPMLAGDADYRLSLAGAQDKLTVGFKDGKVHLIKGGAPTTHILKPIIQRITDSAHNELFCMRLAKRMGIDVPETTLHFVDDTPYYLVERYDRKIEKGKPVERIHQEDFCQALGIAPENKYEKEGGPSISDCKNIIQHTKESVVNKMKFENIVIFNYLIGNADAHGKNYSILYKEDKLELSPAYDLLSTAIYESLPDGMAMKIGGTYKFRDIYLRNFYKMVPDTKVAHSEMDKRIKKMAKNIVTNAIELKNEIQKEGVESDIFEKIIEIIEKHSKRLID